MANDFLARRYLGLLTGAESPYEPPAAGTPRTTPAPEDLASVVRRAAADAGLDENFVMSVVGAESNWNPNAVSHDEQGKPIAYGLMQLIPDTARRFGVQNIMDPVENALGGTRYLAYLRDLFGGDHAKMAAAYHAGEGAVMQYGGVPPNSPKTAAYVERVLSGVQPGAGASRESVRQGVATESWSPEEQDLYRSVMGHAPRPRRPPPAPGAAPPTPAPAPEAPSVFDNIMAKVRGLGEQNVPRATSVPGQIYRRTPIAGAEAQAALGRLESQPQVAMGGEQPGGEVPQNELPGVGEALDKLDLEDYVKRAARGQATLPDNAEAPVVPRSWIERLGLPPEAPVDEKGRPKFHYESRFRDYPAMFARGVQDVVVSGAQLAYALPREFRERAALGRKQGWVEVGPPGRKARMQVTPNDAAAMDAVANEMDLFLDSFIQPEKRLRERLANEGALPVYDAAGRVERYFTHDDLEHMQPYGFGAKAAEFAGGIAGAPFSPMAKALSPLGESVTGAILGKEGASAAEAAGQAAAKRVYGKAVRAGMGSYAARGGLDEAIGPVKAQVQALMEQGDEDGARRALLNFFGKTWEAMQPDVKAAMEAAHSTAQATARATMRKVALQEAGALRYYGSQIAGPAAEGLVWGAAATAPESNEDNASWGRRMLGNAVTTAPMFALYSVGAKAVSRIIGLALNRPDMAAVRDVFDEVYRKSQTGEPITPDEANAWYRAWDNARALKAPIEDAPAGAAGPGKPGWRPPQLGPAPEAAGLLPQRAGPVALPWLNQPPEAPPPAGDPRAYIQFWRPWVTGEEIAAVAQDQQGTMRLVDVAHARMAAYREGHLLGQATPEELASLKRPGAPRMLILRAIEDRIAKPLGVEVEKPQDIPAWVLEAPLGGEMPTEAIEPEEQPVTPVAAGPVGAAQPTPIPAPVQPQLPPGPPPPPIATTPTAPERPFVQRPGGFATPEEEAQGVKAIEEFFKEPTAAPAAGIPSPSGPIKTPPVTQPAPAGQVVKPKKTPFEGYLEGLDTESREILSYAPFKTGHLLEHMGKDAVVALKSKGSKLPYQWIVSDTGSALDDAAKSLTESLGREVTERDIVKVIQGLARGRSRGLERPSTRFGARDPDVPEAGRLHVSQLEAGQSFVATDGAEYTVASSSGDAVVLETIRNGQMVSLKFKPTDVASIAFDTTMPPSPRINMPQGTYGAEVGPEAPAGITQLQALPPPVREALIKFGIAQWFAGDKDEAQFIGKLKDRFGPKVAPYAKAVYDKIRSLPFARERLIPQGGAGGPAPVPAPGAGAGPARPPEPGPVVGVPQPPSGGGAPRETGAQPAPGPREAPAQPEKPKVVKQAGEQDRLVREGGVATVGYDKLPKIGGEVDIWFPRSITNILSDKLGRTPLIHQKENVLRTVNAWLRNHDFMVGDGTGTGKTTTAGILSWFLFQAKPNAKILYVLPNQGLMKQSMADTFSKLGINGYLYQGSGFNTADRTVHFATYTRLQLERAQKRLSLMSSWQPDVIIFDESQYLKNTYTEKTKVTLAVQELLANVRKTSRPHVLFMSGTPFESVLHTKYVYEPFRLGEKGEDWEEYVSRKMGIRYDEMAGEWRNISPKKMALEWEHYTRSGRMVRNEMHFGSIKDRAGRPLKYNINFRFNTPTKEKAHMRGVVDMALLGLEQQIVSSGGDAKALRMFGSVRYMIYRALDENQKLDGAIERSREAHKAGRSVILALFRKESTDLAKWWGEAMGEPYFDEQKGKMVTPKPGTRQWKVGSPMAIIVSYLKEHPWTDFHGKPQKGVFIEGPVRRLLQEFPQAALVTGDQPAGGRERAHNVQQFMEGKAKTLIMTIHAGGTGLDAHDRIGNAPREMHLISGPDTAMQFKQVIGRAFRLGSQSDAWSYIHFIDEPSDHKLARKEATALRAMDAQVQGTIENATAQEMLEFDFPDLGDEIAPVPEADAPEAPEGTAAFAFRDKSAGLFDERPPKEPVVPESEAFIPAKKPKQPEQIELPQQARQAMKDLVDAEVRKRKLQEIAARDQPKPWADNTLFGAAEKGKAEAAQPRLPGVPKKGEPAFEPFARERLTPEKIAEGVQKEKESLLAEEIGAQERRVDRGRRAIIDDVAQMVADSMRARGIAPTDENITAQVGADRLKSWPELPTVIKRLVGETTPKPPEGGGGAPPGAVPYRFISGHHIKPNVEGTEAKLPTRSRMLKEFETGLSTKIVHRRMGRTAKSVLAFFKVKPNVVHARLRRDVETIAGHEIGGHRLSSILFGYNPVTGQLLERNNPELRRYSRELAPLATKGDPLSEGFAEFMRLYITDAPRAQSAAPNVYALMQTTLADMPELDKVILRLRNDWDLYIRRGSSLARVIASIEMPRPGQRGGGQMLAKLEQKPSERYSFTTWVKDLRRRYESDLVYNRYFRDLAMRRDPTKTVAPSVDPSYVAAATADAHAWADSFYWQGTFGFHSPNEKRGPGLGQLYEELGKDYLQWEAWRKCYRAQSLIETRQWDAFEKIGLYQEDIAKVLKDAPKRFLELHNKAQKWERDLFAVTVDADLLDPETYVKAVAMNPIYSPLIRLLTEEPGGPFQEGHGGRKANIGPTVHAIKGSDLPTMPSLGADYRLAHVIFDRAWKNRNLVSWYHMSNLYPDMGRDFFELVPMQSRVAATTNILEIAKRAAAELGLDEKQVKSAIDAGLASALGRRDADNLLKHLVEVFRPSWFQPPAPYVWGWFRGKRFMCRLHPELYRWFMTRPGAPDALLGGVRGFFATSLRATAVGYVPGFLLMRSPMRDVPTAIVKSEHPLQHIANLPGALANQLLRPGSEPSRRYQLSGAYTSSMLRPESEELMRRIYLDLAKMRPEDIKDRLDRWYQTVAYQTIRLASKWAHVGHAFETAPRQAEANVRGLMQANNLNEMLAAGVPARTATVDFSDAGTLLRLLGARLPFMQVAIGATINNIKSLSGRHEPRTPGEISHPLRLAGRSLLRILWRVLTILAPISAMSFGWALLRRDKRYFQLPAEERANYWCFFMPESFESMQPGELKDSYIRIPKPPFFGDMLNLVEATIESSLAHDPETFVRWAQATFRDARFVSGWLDPLSLAAIEQWANRDMRTGSPIVPHEEDQLPETAYYPWTNILSRRIAEKTGIAGPRIDHFVSRVFATVGRETLAGVSRMMYPQESLELPPRTLADTPVFGQLFGRYPTVSMEGMRRFYAAYEPLRKAHGSIGAAGRTDPWAYGDIIAGHPEGMVAAGPQAIADVINVLRRSLYLAYSDPELRKDSVLERQFANETMQKMDELAWRGVAMIREINAATKGQKALPPVRTGPFPTTEAVQ